MTGQMPLPQRSILQPIGHPNDAIEFVPRRTVSFSGVPPTHFDSEGSSDEEVSNSQLRFRNRTTSEPVLPTIPMAQVIDPSLGRRPYSYFLTYPNGLRYASMKIDLQALNSLLGNQNSKGFNIKPYVEIFAKRSPEELVALKAMFSTSANNINLQVLLTSALAKEDDCVKSTFTGLVLGPIEFDLWLLEPQV